MNKKSCLVFMLLYISPIFASNTLFNPKYEPNIELGLKTGNKRDIARLGVIIPVYTTNKGLVFANIFGMLDSIEAREGNFGIGYRHLENNYIIGAYGFYDKRLSQYNNLFNQLTFGGEYLREHFEFRTNIYLPLDKDKKVFSEKSKSRSNFTTITKNNVLFEKALSGFDVELGGNSPSLQSLEGFIAYYYFQGSNIKAIHGPRIRTNLHLTNNLSIEGELSYDRLRDIAYFVGVNLHCVIGKHQASLSKLRKKMTQMAIRDIDVITDSYEIEEVIAIAQDMTVDNIEPIDELPKEDLKEEQSQEELKQEPKVCTKEEADSEREKQEDELNKYYQESYNPYKDLTILGLTQELNEDIYKKVKKAYRKHALKLHPDRNVGKYTKEKKDKWHAINEAYERLTKWQEIKKQDSVEVEAGKSSNNPSQSDKFPAQTSTETALVVYTPPVAQNPVEKKEQSAAKPADKIAINSFTGSADVQSTIESIVVYNPSTIKLVRKKSGNQDGTTEQLIHVPSYNIRGLVRHLPKSIPQDKLKQLVTDDMHWMVGKYANTDNYYVDGRMRARGGVWPLLVPEAIGGALVVGAGIITYLQTPSYDWSPADSGQSSVHHDQDVVNLTLPPRNENAVDYSRSRYGAAADEEYHRNIQSQQAVLEQQLSAQMANIDLNSSSAVVTPLSHTVVDIAQPLAPMRIESGAAAAAPVTADPRLFQNMPGDALMRNHNFYRGLEAAQHQQFYEEEARKNRQQAQKSLEVARQSAQNLHAANVEHNRIEQERAQRLHAEHVAFQQSQTQLSQAAAGWSQGLQNELSAAINPVYGQITGKRAEQAQAAQEMQGHGAYTLPWIRLNTRVKNIDKEVLALEQQASQIQAGFEQRAAQEQSHIQLIDGKLLSLNEQQIALAQKEAQLRNTQLKLTGNQFNKEYKQTIMASGAMQEEINSQIVVLQQEQTALEASVHQTTQEVAGQRAGVNALRAEIGQLNVAPSLTAGVQGAKQEALAIRQRAHNNSISAIETEHARVTNDLSSQHQDRMGALHHRNQDRQLVAQINELMQEQQQYQQRKVEHSNILLATQANHANIEILQKRLAIVSAEHAEGISQEIAQLVASNEQLQQALTESAQALTSKEESFNAKSSVIESTIVSSDALLETEKQFKRDAAATVVTAKGNAITNIEADLREKVAKIRIAMESTIQEDIEKVQKLAREKQEEAARAAEEASTSGAAAAPPEPPEDEEDNNKSQRAEEKEDSSQDQNSWRQDKKLTPGEIDKLKAEGIDVHELKWRKNAGRRDLFKDKQGNIIAKPKSGEGQGEPTGLNIKDF